MKTASHERDVGGDARPGALAFKVGDRIGHAPQHVALVQPRSSAFMRLSGSKSLSHTCDMPAANAELAERIRTWMRETLADKGLTIVQWAADAKVHKSSIHRALTPTYQFVTSSSTLAKLAAAVGVQAPDTTEGRHSTTSEEIALPILHEVAAGAWATAEDLFDEPPVTQQVFRIPPFQDYAQWLERVRGDSYNQRIPDGALVHVVDAIELGYAPRHGDTVVVLRRRAQGAFLERSLKQVEVTPDGVELWPRSFNPRWSSALHLAGGTSENEDVEVEVVGLVLRAYMDLR